MIDIQNSTDTRNISIAQVGIKNVKIPILFTDNNEKKSTFSSVAQFDLSVSLPAEKKGTHMSRFLPLLYDYASSLSLQTLENLSLDMADKMDSSSSFIHVTFPFFIEKQAPVSKMSGLLDVEVALEIKNKKGNIETKLSVFVPIKSLCPCSKAISENGAHSQRGIIAIHIYNSSVSIQQCVQFAESAASSPLYPILKREDEKYVTENAYNTPRFVEDLVRETAFSLKKHYPQSQFEVTAENFESIHNHNAWACVQSGDIL